MKFFYEGMIALPAGKKAGKALQKVAQVSDLSSLVKSLSFCVVELTTQKDYRNALEQCHSCQSKETAMALFFDVWSQLPNVKLVGLIDDNQNIVARGLCNPSQGTMAPCYGESHYLLRSRLEFAGFELGEIAKEGEITPFLTNDTMPDFTIDQAKKIKSRTIIEKIIVHSPTSETWGNIYEPIVDNSDKNKGGNYLQLSPWWQSSSRDKAVTRKYHKAVKNHAKDGFNYGDDIVYYLEKKGIALSGLEYREKWCNTWQSTLYVDRDGCFYDNVENFHEGYVLNHTFRYLKDGISWSEDFQTLFLYGNLYGHGDKLPKISKEDFNLISKYIHEHLYTHKNHCKCFDFGLICDCPDNCPDITCDGHYTLSCFSL